MHRTPGWKVASSNPISSSLKFSGIQYLCLAYGRPLAAHGLGEISLIWELNANKQTKIFHFQMQCQWVIHLIWLSVGSAGELSDGGFSDSSYSRLRVLNRNPRSSQNGSANNSRNSYLSSPEFVSIWLFYPYKLSLSIHCKWFWCNVILIT